LGRGYDFIACAIPGAAAPPRKPPPLRFGNFRPSRKGRAGRRLAPSFVTHASAKADTTMPSDAGAGHPALPAHPEHARDSLCDRVDAVFERELDAVERQGDDEGEKEPPGVAGREALAREVAGDCQDQRRGEADDPAEDGLVDRMDAHDHPRRADGERGEGGERQGRCARETPARGAGDEHGEPAIGGGRRRHVTAGAPNIEGGKEMAAGDEDDLGEERPAERDADRDAPPGSGAALADEEQAGGDDRDERQDDALIAEIGDDADEAPLMHLRLGRARPSPLNPLRSLGRAVLSGKGDSRAPIAAWLLISLNVNFNPPHPEPRSASS
jgi:hypothetical protein